MGVEPEDHPAAAGERPRAESGPERGARPIPEPMAPGKIAILAAFVGLFYAVGMVARGAVAPGLIGGVLAAILCFLVMREVGERQRRRIRARERSRSSS